MLILSFIVAALGTFFTVSFLLLLFKGAKYQEFVDALDEKAFPLKQVYVTGYALLDLIHYSYRNRLSRRLYEDAKILYDEKYAQFYMRACTAQCLSLTHLLLALGFTMAMLSPNVADQPLIALLVAAAAGVVFYYYATLMNSKLKKQSDRYMGQFPEVVSKLALLINSGMMLREAWKTIAFSSEEEIYILMRRTTDEIDNGKSEGDAYYHFGILCGVQEIRKFISMLTQNLSKGTADLALILSQQSKEIWEKKRQYILKKGELAASKLMMPIGLMFIGILIIVIVPIITSINM